MDLKVLLATPFKQEKAAFRASWKQLIDDEFIYVVHLWQPQCKSWHMAVERVLDRKTHTRFHWASMGSKHTPAATGIGSSSSPKIPVGDARLLQQSAAPLLHHYLSTRTVSLKPAQITQPGCTHVPQVHRPSGFPYTPAVCLCCTCSAAQQSPGAPTSMLFNQFAQVSVWQQDAPAKVSTLTSRMLFPVL